MYVCTYAYAYVCVFKNGQCVCAGASLPTSAYMIKRSIAYAHFFEAKSRELCHPSSCVLALGCRMSNAAPQPPSHFCVVAQTRLIHFLCFCPLARKIKHRSRVIFCLHMRLCKGTGGRGAFPEAVGTVQIHVTGHRQVGACIIKTGMTKSTNCGMME